MFIELNFRKSKWLLFGTYHPPSQMDDLYFDSVGRAFDIYNDKYDEILLAGDFNAEDNENILKNFIELYNLHNLVKEKTCFKSFLNAVLIFFLQTAICLFSILKLSPPAYRIATR